jgi:hypothetical protein
VARCIGHLWLAINSDLYYQCNIIVGSLFISLHHHLYLLGIDGTSPLGLIGIDFYVFIISAGAGGGTEN